MVYSCHENKPSCLLQAEFMITLSKGQATSEKNVILISKHIIKQMEADWFPRASLKLYPEWEEPSTLAGGRNYRGFGQIFSVK